MNFEGKPTPQVIKISGQIRASKRGYTNDPLVVELALAQWSWPANGHPYLPLATNKEAIALCLGCLRAAQRIGPETGQPQALVWAFI